MREQSDLSDLWDPWDLWDQLDQWDLWGAWDLRELRDLWGLWNLCDRPIGLGPRSHHLHVARTLHGTRAAMPWSMVLARKPTRAACGIGAGAAVQ